MASHLLFQATNGMDIGAVSMMLYGWREREEVLRLLRVRHRPADELQLHPARRRRGRPSRRLAGARARACATSSRRGVARVRRAALARTRSGASARSASASSPPRSAWSAASPGRSCARPASPGTCARRSRTSPYDEVDFDVIYTQQRRRVRPLPHPALRDPRVGEDRAAVRGEDAGRRLPRPGQEGHAAAARPHRRVDGSADPPLQALHRGLQGAAGRDVRRDRVAARRDRLLHGERRLREAGAHAHPRAVVLQPAVDRADGHGAASSPTRSRSCRASTRSWARSTGERFFTRREPACARDEIVARYPQPKSAILPLAHLAQDQDGWLIARGDGRDRRAHRRDRGRRAGDLLLLHDVQAPPVREAARVGVHERHVSRHRRSRDPRAPRGRATRPTPTSRSKRSSASPRAAARRRCRSTTSSTRRSRREPRRRSSRSTSAARARRARSRDRVGAHVTSEERRIVTKRLHDRPDDSWTIDGALATGAYEVLRDVLAQGRPGRHAGAGEAVGPARARRRRTSPTGQKWSFLPADLVPALPRGQRRRRRAVDVQGPHARRARSASAHRRHRHLGVRDPVQPGVRLPPRRVRARLRPAHAGARRRARARASSARTSSVRASTSRSSCTAARARTSAARRPRCSSRSRASGACRASSRRSRRSRASTRSRPS